MTALIPPSSSHGLGIGILEKDPFLGLRLYTHSGANPGYQAQWLYYPDKDLTIFIAVNRNDYPNESTRESMERLSQAMTEVLKDFTDLFK